MTGAHKTGDAGIVKAHNMPGQAALDSVPTKYAKLRTREGILSSHDAAHNLSSRAVAKVTEKLAPMRVAGAKHRAD